MDVFKLAFETIVVGLLAFVWLGVATYLFSPDFLSDLLSRRIPAFAKDNQTLLSVAVLTVAYCLGSAILPISSQLLNDEHWPLPENAIRCQVFIQQQIQLQGIDFTVVPKHLSPHDVKPVHCSYWAPMFEDFQFQESKLLNQGTDHGEQLKLLHERIVVLRGAVFSGFVLSLLCLFAYFAPVFGHPAHWIKTVCGGLLAISLAVFALLNGLQDLFNHQIFDIPVLEGLVFSVFSFGAIVVARGLRTAIFLKKRYLFAVIFFALLAYGGWMSSEIIYDQQVISSFAVPQSGEIQKQ